MGDMVVQYGGCEFPKCNLSLLTGNADACLTCAKMTGLYGP